MCVPIYNISTECRLLSVQNIVFTMQMERNLCNNCVRRLKKNIQDFNGIWTRDLAILVRCSNQLSYEATDSPIVF